MTLDEAKAAVQDFFDDRSRSQEATLVGLEELGADIEGMIDAIKEDLRG